MDEKKLESEFLQIKIIAGATLFASIIVLSIVVAKELL